MFWIDMNSVRGDEVGALLRHATDPIRAQINRPQVGQLVLTTDEERNQCMAVVQRVTDRWVGLRLDWDSWMPSIVPVIETTVDQGRPDLKEPRGVTGPAAKLTSQIA